MSFKEYLAEAVVTHEELSEDVENLDESLKDPKGADIIVIDVNDVDDIEVTGRKIIVSVDSIKVDDTEVTAELCASIGGLHLEDEDGNTLYDENNILHFDYKSDIDVTKEDDTRDTAGSTWKTSNPKLSNFAREKYDHKYDDTKETKIINEALDKVKSDKDVQATIADKVDTFLSKDKHGIEYHIK